MTAGTHSPRVYAVLADDLTGAADTGIEFAQVGWHTRTLRHAWQPADLHGAQVVVVDTATRPFTPAAAYAGVQRAARQLQAAGAALVYKKIDSTLRGPLGAELDAALAASGFRLAVVCPAFPAQGRTLVSGMLLVDTVPVAETAAGRDPVVPVRESHLPSLLAAQTQRPIQHIPLAPGGYSVVELVSYWRLLLPDGGISVVDAANDQDLAQIVAAGIALGEPPLWVGSAGLARPLAAALVQAAGLARSGRSPQAQIGDRVYTADVPRSRHVLVLCGSLHPVARTQAHAVAAQLDASSVTLLATPGSRLEGASPQQAAQLLAETAVAWLQSHAVEGVVVTGGDTLDAFLDALGAGGIDLHYALASGIAVGCLAGGPWSGLRIVSKAGGFGAADTLVNAALHLLGV